MGFRITTNMMMNSYRYNLQNSTLKLSNARDMVLTQRNYNSYAEDPAAATQEFRLRREFYNTYSQLNNTKNVYSKYNTAWNNLQGIKTKLIDGTAIQAVMRGDNDPTGEARRALAVTLRETSESLIFALNQKLGDQFIFAGNDGLNVPFEWKGEDLYYRGINVKSGGLVDKPTAKEPTWLEDWKGAIDGLAQSADPDDQAESARALSWYNYYTHKTDVKPDDPASVDEYMDALLNGKTLSAKEKEWVSYYTHRTSDKPTADLPDWANDPTDLDENGIPKTIPTKGQDDVEQGWIAYYNDQKNYVTLKEMDDEQLYIDLGMGLAEKSPNNAVNGSYFNSALCGISFTDFGVDEDGDPKNLALLMREFADIFQAWDEDMEPQGYNPELAGPTAKGLTSAQMEEKAYRLLDKFKDSREHCVEKWDELDAQSVFLVTNQERLETQMTDTNTQILDISQVDLADAITSFSWQQYCYNAALKIGNQLLSQSLIDYMS